MKGILITLEKRAQVLHDNYTENYNYTIFGHYDGMDVKSIDCMGKLCPSFLSEQRNMKNKDKLNDGISDEYTIKAIYPSSEELCRTTKKINYEMWESEKVKKQIQKKYPFVSCIIAHLSESCFKKNTPSDILEKIIKMIDTENSIDSDGVRCAVYFSIGYSDIIILARINHFSKINPIVEKINQLETSENEKWISDLYTIMGFDKEAFSTPDNIIDIYNSSQKEKITFCVTFKIKSGFSAVTFKNTLLKNISNTLDYFSSLKESKDINNFVNYDVEKRFGGIDVEFRINIPAVLFPAFYCEKCEGAFFHKSDFFKKYIRTIQVFILEKIDEMENSTENLSNTTYFKLDEEKYENFLDDFKKVCKTEHLPMRLWKSIFQIMRLYRALAEPKHGFEVKAIVDEAMQAFIVNMNIAIKLLDSREENKENKQNKECKVEDPEEINRGKLIKDVEKAVTVFRSYIVTYLNDLHRSERSFIEGRTMTHPSIGASTKLLFSYNKFIKKLVEKNNPKKEKYSFIVISGDCDQTKMNELFQFLDVWDKTYYHLFVVTIPEVSLFDIKGTLLRLSHECFHCHGNRQRKNRTYYAMYAWATYITETISEKLFNTEIYKLKELSLSEDNGICSLIEEQRKEFCQEMKKLLEKEIRYMFSQDTIGEDDKDFYSSRCVEKIKQDLGRYFVLTHEVMSPVIYNDALKLFLKSQHKILRIVLERTKQGSQCKAIIREMFSEIGYFIHNINSAANPEDAINIMNMDNLCTNLFANYFSSIVDPKRIIYADSMLIADKYKKTNNQNILNHDTHEQIDKELCFLLESFPNNIIDVMSECFSDYQAVHVLNVEMEEFVVAWLYETRDIIKAMPSTINNVLCVGIDLDILFGISTVQAFDENKKEQIRYAVKQYNKAGFQIDVEIETYIRKIEQILQKYQKVKSVGEIVKDYLKNSASFNVTIFQNFQYFYSLFRKTDTLSQIYAFLDVDKEL